jgi:hypothetical protein
LFVILAFVATSSIVSLPAAQPAPEDTIGRCGGAADDTPLTTAQRLFYNGDYEQTVALTSGACGAAESLELCELRTSALLFEIKKEIGSSRDKDQAWRACTRCPQLMTAFQADTGRGQTAARAILHAAPNDEATRFLLAKLDLNYVWLQLGVLGRKTGWGEYWEARRSLDKVLSVDPAHLRARVARAWIDYIVDTRMPKGTRWLLGGGNKKRGLLIMREAASGDGDFYAKAEAVFALWDVQTREKQMADAVVTARRLACDFPDNEELRRFLETHDNGGAQYSPTN